MNMTMRWFGEEYDTITQYEQIMIHVCVSNLYM